MESMLKYSNKLILDSWLVKKGLVIICVSWSSGCLLLHIYKEDFGQKNINIATVRFDIN